MNGKFNFENLKVYQITLDFVNQIYLITKNWPKDELFGLSDQTRRAVVSTLLNIAEGSSRTKKDFRHFLDLARGSSYEVVACIQIARARNYINEKQYQSAYSSLEVISKMISGLKRSLL